MQMLQFVVMVLHGLYILALDCPYPPRVMAFYVGYIAFMLLLFLHFYIRKHCCGRAKAAQVAPGKKGQ